MRAKLVIIVSAMLCFSDTFGEAITCMTAPTVRAQQGEAGAVSGRFGEFRGASSWANPHPHDGLDFSTYGQNQPIFSTTDGVVSFVGPMGAFGPNTVVVKRANGDAVLFGHMKQSNVKVGARVTPGQILGVSGNLGVIQVHLHLTYATASRNELRAKVFKTSLDKRPPTEFFASVKDVHFGTVISSGTYKTDPTPYFCNTFRIQPDKYAAYLGTDTKAQYVKLFGAQSTAFAVSPEQSVKYTPVQVAAVNMAAIGADAEGAIPSSPGAALSDIIPSDSGFFGSVPDAPIGDYEHLSEREMLSLEARRRFTNTNNWNQSLSQATTRALYQDFLKARAVGLLLQQRLQEKQEKIEGMLALYTSMKMESLRQKANQAQRQVSREAARAAMR